MVPFETIEKLYRGVVLPALDYCDVVWHGCRKSASNKLEVVHNNALQFISHTVEKATGVDNPG